MAFYKKRVVVQDTLAMIAERIAYRAACEQAIKDRVIKFPVLTIDNFEAANQYQQQRIKELTQTK